MEELGLLPLHRQGPQPGLFSRKPDKIRWFNASYGYQVPRCLENVGLILAITKVQDHIKQRHRLCYNGGPPTCLNCWKLYSLRESFLLDSTD